MPETVFSPAGDSVEPAAIVQRREGRRQSWLPYLSLFLLAQIAVLLSVARHDRALLDRLQERTDAYTIRRRAQENRRNDPALGTPLSAGIIPALRAAITRGGFRGETILVFIGPCASCTARDLKQWQSIAAHNPQKRVLIVSRDTPSNIARFVESERFLLPIVADPGGVSAKAFNVTWIPRTYQVNEKGALTWIQTEDATNAQMVADALWEGNAK